jgi:TolB-like protein/tetratricopeptide (TPR) repeat protein
MKGHIAMTEPTKAVFLSYASEDADAVEHICVALRAAGIEVWFDKNELRGGDAWDMSIRQQIKACALFVPVISANTQARPEGYFRLEWKLAVDRSHLMASEKAFLLPVVIDATGDAAALVPDRFREVQWTRLPAGETPGAFVERVKTLLNQHIHAASEQSAPGVHRTLARSRLWIGACAVAAVLAVGGVVYWQGHRTEGAGARIASDTSIAVLPFLDMSEKKDQEYFSDGLADELLDLLAKIPQLQVIARTSSFHFKGKSDDIATIARVLNVANILEGSVRKSGNHIRITTQLIRAATGVHLWSDTYDREMEDVFKVQDEIATAVVGALKVHLLPDQRIGGTQTTQNVEAYNQYLLGRDFGLRSGAENQRRAIKAYRAAIALDPNYAEAYANLAAAQFALADTQGDRAPLEEAMATAEKAVELGPDQFRGYAVRGYLRMFVNWDWHGASADIEKALAISPGRSAARIAHARILANTGQYAAAVDEARKAIKSDPLVGGNWENLTEYLITAGQYTEAHDTIRRALEIVPDDPYSQWALGELLLLEHKAPEALEGFRKVSFEPFALTGIAMAEHSLDHPKESQQARDTLINKYSAGGALQVAEVYAWAGDKDRAFEWLQRALAQRDSGLGGLKADPLFNSLHGDSRYQALLRQINLPE